MYMGLLWTLQKKRSVSWVCYYHLILISFLLKCVFLFNVKPRSHWKLTSSFAVSFLFCTQSPPFLAFWRFSSICIMEGFPYIGWIKSSSVGHIKAALAETCKESGSCSLGQELETREPRSPDTVFQSITLCDEFIVWTMAQGLVCLGGNTSK